MVRTETGQSFFRVALVRFCGHLFFIFSHAHWQTLVCVRASERVSGQRGAQSYRERGQAEKIRRPRLLGQAKVIKRSKQEREIISTLRRSSAHRRLRMTLDFYSFGSMILLIEKAKPMLY
jgi:hypothetical protein